LNGYTVAYRNRHRKAAPQAFLLMRRRRYWRRVDHYRMKSRDYAHVRYARLRNSSFQFFSSLEIFERDGWRCWICGKPTRKKARFRQDPLSASIDHVIPVSKGGAHTKRNVRCAHLFCNKKRSNAL
jgi:5-methylcytosine-specific restriction endonuclease McrA